MWVFVLDVFVGLHNHHFHYQCSVESFIQCLYSTIYSMTVIQVDLVSNCSIYFGVLVFVVYTLHYRMSYDGVLNRIKWLNNWISFFSFIRDYMNFTTSVHMIGTS